MKCFVCCSFISSLILFGFTHTVIENWWTTEKCTIFQVWFGKLQRFMKHHLISITICSNWAFVSVNGAQHNFIRFYFVNEGACLEMDLDWSGVLPAVFSTGIAGGRVRWRLASAGRCDARSSVSGSSSTTLPPVWKKKKNPWEYNCLISSWYLILVTAPPGYPDCRGFKAKFRYIMVNCSNGKWASCPFSKHDKMQRFWAKCGPDVSSTSYHASHIKQEFCLFPQWYGTQMKR